MWFVVSGRSRSVTLRLRPRRRQSCASEQVHARCWCARGHAGDKNAYPFVARVVRAASANTDIDGAQVSGYRFPPTPSISSAAFRSRSRMRVIASLSFGCFAVLAYVARYISPGMRVATSTAVKMMTSRAVATSTEAERVSP